MCTGAYTALDPVGGDATAKVCHYINVGDEVELSYPACRNYRHLPLCYAPKSSVGMPIGRVNAPAQRAGTHVVG